VEQQEKKKKKKKKENLFDSSSSNDSDEDSVDSKEEEKKNVFIPTKLPKDEVLERGLGEMKQFLENLNKFQYETGTIHIQAKKEGDLHMGPTSDLWKIKDIGFQPLKVHLDVQEYMPGLFDILKPKN